MSVLLLRLEREERLPPGLPAVIPAAPRAGGDPATAGGHADRLVTKYHYLCRRAARKFVRGRLERGDLEQVAAVGLIKASRRYDASAATPFEAYAWLVVIGELMHYVRDHERLIRLPRRLGALEARFDRARETLVARFGGEPSGAALANEMGVPVATVDELRRAREAAVPLALEEASANAFAAGSALSLEDRLLVDHAFSTLGQIERRIIVGVYILGLTQLELGRRLGLSAKQVSRRHHAALADMQRTWAC